MADCPRCSTRFSVPQPEISSQESSVETPAAPARDLAFANPNPNGALTCPVCWLRFDKGNIMHIAVHDSLRGDPRFEKLLRDTLPKYAKPFDEPVAKAAPAPESGR